MVQCGASLSNNLMINFHQFLNVQWAYAYLSWDILNAIPAIDINFYTQINIWYIIWIYIYKWYMWEQNIYTTIHAKVYNWFLAFIAATCSKYTCIPSNTPSTNRWCFRYPLLCTRPWWPDPRADPSGNPSGMVAKPNPAPQEPHWDYMDTKWAWSQLLQWT